MGGLNKSKFWTCGPDPYMMANEDLMVTPVLLVESINLQS